MCSRCAARAAGSLVLAACVCASQLLPQDDRALPGHQPDVGPEWAHSLGVNGATLYATGSNSVRAFAGLAAGSGAAFNASILID